MDHLDGWRCAYPSYRYFGLAGTRAEFWMGLQADYDMAIARASLGDALNRIHRFEPVQS